MKVAIPYGAFELKRAYQKNLGLAIIIAGLVHFLLISSYMFFNPVEIIEPSPRGRIFIDPRDFGPPPSIAQDAIQKIFVPPNTELVPPSIGIPSTVPDDQIKETFDFPTQHELASLQSPSLVLEGINPNETLIVQPSEGYIPSSDTFIPYDEAPEPIKLVEPSYPELARRSGLEGKIWVEAYIDKHGIVREARCIKIGSVNPDIFCEAATKAAVQNEYKPAISNKEPVAVWVTYKVEFRLK